MDNAINIEGLAEAAAQIASVTVRVVVIAGEVGRYLDLVEAVQETGVDTEGWTSRDLLDLEARGGIEYLDDVSRVQLFRAIKAADPRDRESLAGWLTGTKTIDEALSNAKSG